VALLFVHEEADREYLLDPGETLETDLGVLEVPAEVTAGQVVTTHLDEPFRARELRGPDLFHHLERTGAPMLPRDVGLVIGTAGLGVGDRVLDVGTGTGVLAASLGRVGAEVLSFERDPDSAAVARENMALAGVEEAVEVRTGDAREALSAVGPVDAMTLDTGDAPDLIERAPDLLVPGGFAVVYSPFVEMSREAVEAASRVGLEEVETLETIQRAMEFGDRGTRPSTTGVGHTGYLTFARRP